MEFEEVPGSIPLRNLPPPFFRLRPTWQQCSDFTLDIYEANWSRLTKKQAAFRTLFRWFRDALMGLHRGYRAASRKFWIELTSLEVVVFAIILAFISSIAGVVALTNRITSGSGMISGVLATLLIVGAWPLLANALALVSERLKALGRFLLKGWHDGAGLQWTERIPLALLFAQEASQNANGIFWVIRFAPAVLVSSLCFASAFVLAKLYDADITWSHVGAKGWGSILLATLALPLIGGVLRNYRNALLPLEDIYAFAHTDAGVQAATGSLAAVESVAEQVRAVLRARDPGGKRTYDKVVICGHSMGSFIAMQAITLLARAERHGAIPTEDLARMGSFISYGSAIEKVWTYLRASRLSKSLLEDLVWYWADKLFCPSSHPRAGAIRWANIWYSTDLVADRISVVAECCANLHPRSPSVARVPWSHSAYLGSSALWHVIFYEALGDVLCLPSPYMDADVQCLQNAATWWGSSTPRPGIIKRVAIFLGSLFAASIASEGLLVTGNAVLGAILLWLGFAVPLLAMRAHEDRINLHAAKTLADPIVS